RNGTGADGQRDNAEASGSESAAGGNSPVGFRIPARRLTGSCPAPRQNCCAEGGGKDGALVRQHGCGGRDQVGGRWRARDDEGVGGLDPPSYPVSPDRGVNTDQETRGGEDEAEEAPSIAGDGMWDEAAQQYCIVARRWYRRGEQVMLCYGRYTNLELLEHYGFVLQYNPHDTALLDPALLPVPSAARTSAGSPCLTPADCFLHANGQPSWQLLHFLRYCAASPAERRSAGHRMAAGAAVSQQGDRRALQWLHVACSRQLDALPTTLSDDLQLRRQLQFQQDVQNQQQEQEQQEEQQQELQRCHRPGQQQQLSQATSREQGPQHQGQIPELQDSPQSHRPTGRTIRVSEEAAAAAATGPASKQVAPAAPAPLVTRVALSDGLTCTGLALQWRIQQKEILLRALRCAEGVLGLEGVSGAARASGRGAVVGKDLSSLMQRQRQRRPDDVPRL
ncbi:hypothetical protein VaNZ11_007094, partial [Volvox africanus]